MKGGATFTTEKKLRFYCLEITEFLTRRFMSLEPYQVFLQTHENLELRCGWYGYLFLVF